MSMWPFAVGYDEDALYDKALALAEQLNVPIDNQAQLTLRFSQHQLALQMAGSLPLVVDFLHPALKKRLRDKKQGLIQACKPKPGLRILDATAGWGRDSAILAYQGATVTMLERHPVMVALLRDGLSRLQATSSPLALSLNAGDARLLLASNELEDADVIYIDPMHPLRQKSALVKKDMQLLQRLLGVDNDAQELITLACQKAHQRVVVKWPQRLDPLIKPDYSLAGKTVRFDVYLCS